MNLGAHVKGIIYGQLELTFTITFMKKKNSFTLQAMLVLNINLYLIFCLKDCKQRISKEGNTRVQAYHTIQQEHNDCFQ